MRKPVEKLNIVGKNEVYLRSMVVKKLQNLSLKNKKQLASYFEIYYQVDKSVDVIDIFIEAILSAERSQKWFNSTRVNMGFYFKSEEFYTFLFHECTHYVLQSLSVNGSLEKNSKDEELFCWYYSRIMCKTLDLVLLKNNVQNFGFRLSFFK